MTPASNGSRATGLYWHSGKPEVTFSTAAGETSLPLNIGDNLSWRFAGPRRCTGIWKASTATRQLCPHQTVIDYTITTAQCGACAAADPGRALARDQQPHDNRTFALYLAWFGDSLLKVGLTATERGADRLAEQGALAFTWLCHGPYPLVRLAEQQAAATGIARERLQRRTKVASWFRAGDLQQRHDQLTAAHQRLSGMLTLAPGLTPTPADVHDQVGLFGLNVAIPVPEREIVHIADDAVVTGGLACLAGRDAILDTHLGPALVDMRLIAGRLLKTASEPGRGITFKPLTLTGIRDDDHTQQALF